MAPASFTSAKELRHRAQQLQGASSKQHIHPLHLFLKYLIDGIIFYSIFTGEFMLFDNRFSISFELDNNKYELLVNKSEQSNPKIDLLGISPNLSPGQLDKVKSQLANLSTKEEIVSKLKIMGATITLEMVKTHQIGMTNLSSFPQDSISIEEFITKVKNCSEKLSSPPKQEKNEEIMRQLNILSELKKLRQNVKQLDPQNSSNSDFKVALSTLDAHIASIKKYLDSTPVAKIRQEEADNRQQLSVVREKALSDIKKGVSSEQVSKYLSHGIIQFIESIFEEGIKNLGSPPCKYCLAVFGSLARYESGPFPDLDNMLILEKRDEKTLKYFTKLYAYVEERLYRLGESENLGKPGLRLCTGSGSPQYPQYDFRHLNDPTTAEEELKSISAEIDQLQMELTDKTSTELQKIQSKLDKLLKTKEMKIAEISRMRQEGFGGRMDLFIEASLEGVQGKSELNDEQLKKMQNDQRAMSDNIFVCGDLELYQQYRSIVSESVVGKITQSDAGIMETLKFVLKKLEEGSTPGSPSPILTLKLSPITYIKEELYRFPQVIVSLLAAKYKINETNSIARIKALQEKGIINKAFGEKLIDCLNQAVKLRILSQSRYQEEWDLITTVEWRIYSAVKENLKREIAQLPQLNEKILKYESEVKTLKDRVGRGDVAAEPRLFEAEKQLKDLKEAVSKIEFFKLRLETELPKIEQTEFGFQKAEQDLKKLEEENPKLSELIKKHETDIEQCKINIQKLQVENGSKGSISSEMLKLEKMNENLRELRNIQNEMQILKDKLKSYESRGFTVSDPASFEVFKESIVSDADIINLQDNILPTLHKLYEMAQESVSSGSLNLSAFNK